MTLPNGNYPNQTKTIIIPGTMLTGPLGPTETFNITGIFAGYSSMTFDATAFIGIFIWDSGSWIFSSGNAITNP